MRQRAKQAPQSAEEIVRDIRRATGLQFSAEEKMACAARTAYAQTQTRFAATKIRLGLI
jgi:hypothetical protein